MYPSKFIEDILKIHNQYRAIHDSPPLQIDEKVRYHFLSLLQIICLKILSKPYQENRYYNYDAPRPKNVKYVRNFTQLVWKDTKLMGIGIVTGWNGKIYLVCSYDPAGNVDGEFQRNVAPPKEVKYNQYFFSNSHIFQEN
ncbi:hypothetical protein ACFW04_010274 [Cataglyphis niger]